MTRRPRGSPSRSTTARRCDLAWGQPRTIDRLRLVGSDRAGRGEPAVGAGAYAHRRSAARPSPPTGGSRFPAVTTDRLAVVVTGSDAAVADPRGEGWPAPVGVAEVEVPALADLLTRGTASALAAPCGSGPTVSLDGVSYPTSVSGTVADVRAGRSAAGDGMRRLRDRVGAAAGRRAPAAYRAVRVFRDRHGGVDAGRDVGGAGRHPSGLRAAVGRHGSVGDGRARGGGAAGGAGELQRRVDGDASAGRGCGRCGSTGGSRRTRCRRARAAR